VDDLGDQLDHELTGEPARIHAANSERLDAVPALELGPVCRVDLAERIARDLHPLRHLRHVSTIRTQPVARLA
jgi:hypothetical protein